MSDGSDTITIEDISNSIKSIVNANPGMRTTLLPIKLADWNPSALSFDIIKIMSDLIKSNEIVYVGYVLEEMNYREKGLLFPKNTQISLEF